MGSIFFVCGGAYSVWVSSLMSETVYKDYHSVAVIFESLAQKYNLQAKCFDEVHVVCDSINDEDRTARIIDLIKETSPDMIGFFTWGLGYVDVYNSIPNEIPIYLIDEGTSTYNYCKHMRIAVGKIDFTRLKGVWLLNPDISLNDKSVPERRIPVYELIMDREKFKSYLERINSFFNYREFDFDNIVFFDNYLMHAGYIADDCYSFFLKSVLTILGNKTITVKKHPFENEKVFDEKYQSYCVRKYELYEIPWEIVVLNYICRKYYDDVDYSFPIIILGTNTSALITTQMFLSYFDYDYPAVFLNKLIDAWLPDNVNITAEVFEKYRMTYPERKMYMPMSWDEFADAIRKHVGPVDSNSLYIANNNECELLEKIKSEYSDCFNKRRRFNRIAPLVEKSHDIIRYLKKNRYEQVGIYGYGDVGKILRMLLLSEGIRTIVADKTTRDIVISPKELKKQIKDLDLIIVTPIRDFESIRNDLGNVQKIISYEELVEESSKGC